MNIHSLLVAVATVAALTGCAATVTPVPDAVNPPATTEATVTAPTLNPGQTHTFSDGSTVRFDAARYTYPATLGPGWPSLREDRDKRYVLVRLTYTNHTPQPRGMEATLTQVSSPTGDPWTVTLGVDVRQASGPVQPGRTGINEIVFRAPDHDPQATEGFGQIYEPWPDGQGIIGPQGTMPESADMHFDTARLT